MNFYVSADKYGLIRMGKKRALVSRVFATPELPVFGAAFVTNEEKPTQREQITIFRISLTTFAGLTQDDAAAAGYLYLHQLHEDLQKQDPEIDDFSTIRIVYFLRVADLED